ncbi:hypothetical protein LCGC14_1659310 [marine sediment metagenome]|uniref:Radical SAM core domain-containing protein n=1 Tax=marine sediment metagenome TaxID=412755 RepID=A0A0F9KAE9_9ZZZZ
MCARPMTTNDTTASPACGPQAGQRLPVRVTPFYRRQIERSDCPEPLRRMVELAPAESEAAGQSDTSGEYDNTIIVGLQHKYAQTVLVLTTQQCFGYCRYCFRRRFVGQEPSEAVADYPAVAAYIRGHPEISNVLLTGGDPLTLDSDRLGGIIDQLLPIPHVTSIRFGTRAIAFAPDRFRDPKLLAQFDRIRSAGKACVVVTHINHASEISGEAESVVDGLRRADVQLLNQAVLLNGVNDDPDVLTALFEKIQSLGIHPYYLFQARPVLGACHFQVPLDRGIAIVHAVNSRLSGIQKMFRFIMSHRSGKIEILDLAADGRLHMRYHQSPDPMQVGRVFSRPYRRGACWLDDLPET